MTNQEILQIALQQSAYDCNCRPEDFLSAENKIVLSQKNEKARVWLWYKERTTSLKPPFKSKHGGYEYNGY